MFVVPAGTCAVVVDVPPVFVVPLLVPLLLVLPELDDELGAGLPALLPPPQAVKANTAAAIAVKRSGPKLLFIGSPSGKNNFVTQTLVTLMPQP